VNSLDPQASAYRLPPSASGIEPTGEFDPWSLRPESGSTTGLTGYRVEATDGEIGSVDEVGPGHLVVDTGGRLTGAKVMLPAGVIEGADHENRTVHVDRSREQIENAPAYDPDHPDDPAWRGTLGQYYSDTYANAGPPGGTAV
jgi:hypothetical protein